MNSFLTAICLYLFRAHFVRKFAVPNGLIICIHLIFSLPNLFSPDDLNAGYLFNNEYSTLVFVLVPDVTQIQLTAGFSILQATTSDGICLKLVDANDAPLAVMRLTQIELNNQNYYKVDKCHSIQKGKGHMIPLYEYAFVYLDLPIISDDFQTKPGSSDLWKKFQHRQVSNSYEVLILNTNSSTIHLYSTRNFNEYDVWGWDDANIKLYNINPNVLEDDMLFDNSILEDSGEEIEEITFDNDDFPEIPKISERLRKFLKNGRRKVRDRKHIRLIGRVKT